VQAYSLVSIHDRALLTGILVLRTYLELISSVKMSSVWAPAMARSRRVSNWARVSPFRPFSMTRVFLPSWATVIRAAVSLFAWVSHQGWSARKCPSIPRGPLSMCPHRAASLFTVTSFRRFRPYAYDIHVSERLSCKCRGYPGSVFGRMIIVTFFRS